jgi:hypothetical protein
MIQTAALEILDSAKLSIEFDATIMKRKPANNNMIQNSTDSSESEPRGLKSLPRRVWGVDQVSSPGILKSRVKIADTPRVNTQLCRLFVA